MADLTPDTPLCPGVGSDAEGWRAIPGYEGWYAASACGQIKSLDRAVLSSNQFGSFPVERISKVLRQQETADGYLRVCLHIFQRKETRLVHQLIALAFLGTRHSGMQVNHIDGDKFNNRQENLEYATCAGNVLHARRVLNMGVQSGERNGMAKLAASDIAKILADHRRQQTIADEFGITQSTVSKIKRGASWKAAK